MKYVKVPQSDLDKIETSREELWKFFDKNFKDDGSVEYQSKVIEVLNISQPMWYIAHRKFKETLLSKIKQFIIFLKDWGSYD